MEVIQCWRISSDVQAGCVSNTLRWSTFSLSQMDLNVSDSDITSCLPLIPTFISCTVVQRSSRCFRNFASQFTFLFLLHPHFPYIFLWPCSHGRGIHTHRKETQDSDNSRLQWWSSPEETNRGTEPGGVALGAIVWGCLHRCFWYMSAPSYERLVAEARATKR